MALKTFKPTSPGQRHVVIVDRDGLWKGKPVKSLTEGLTKSGGRGNDGRITSRHRGGGHKRTYRLIDFKRRKFDVAATVERLEYDPNRTGYIALINYADGEQSYILAPQRLTVGDSVVSGQSVDVKPGNAMPMGSMPVGTIVHNIETQARQGRAAGALGRLLCACWPAATRAMSLLKLKSGETRWCSPTAWRRSARCPIPTIVNEVVGKAGRSRWKGVRPQYRAASPATRSTIPMAGAPMAASIGRRPGASRPRARRRAATSRRTSSSCAAATTEEAKR